MRASILFGAGWENDSVDVLLRDAGGVFCRLWRNNAEGEKHAFIPILAQEEHLTRESVNCLTHEFELKGYLDSTWALRPRELVRERGRTMLVVDYAAGEVLHRLVGQPMEIGQFLRCARSGNSG